MSLALGNLATTIVAEVPVLIERTLNQEAENLVLQEQVVELKTEIDLIKIRIENERAKQHRLRVQLLRLRGPASRKSSSIHELRLALRPCNVECDSRERSTEYGNDFGSFVSDGSPVSLRSKRKGIVFSDDFRLTKKMKKDNNSPSTSSSS